MTGRNEGGPVTGRVVVVGDALLDRDVEGNVDRVCPDAPVPVLDQTVCHTRVGGAGLTASFLAADGWDVTLVTALADDDAAGEFSRALTKVGVNLFDLGQDGTTPEKVRFRSGQTLLRVDRGRHGRVQSTGLMPALKTIMAEAAAVLVSDYGQGITAHHEIRSALRRAAESAPVVWDPHPRGTSPVPGVAVVKPNLKEALHFAHRSAAGRERFPVTALTEPEAAAELCRYLIREWRSGAVCLTRGEDPVLVVSSDGSGHAIPVIPVPGDVCGAGDRFASALTRELALDSNPPDAARAAVRDATGFVRVGERPGQATYSSNGGPDLSGNGVRPGRTPDARPDRTTEAVLEEIRSVRKGGGLIVATGGCFDLLHSGHVRALQAAARLGEYLLVLINSDRSVKEIKGPDRPLVAEQERALLIRSLSCVDEVLIFDQPTPIEALRLIRPDVWAKGGDYEAEQLPERDVIAGWGGRIAILPFIEERSTTRLIEEAGARVRA